MLFGSPAKARQAMIAKQLSGAARIEILEKCIETLILCGESFHLIDYTESFLYDFGRNLSYCSWLSNAYWLRIP